MKLHAVAFILVIVGAISWGLVGLSGFFQMNWNVIDLLLYKLPFVELAIYVLVGLSGIYLISTHKRDCKMCEPKVGGQM